VYKELEKYIGEAVEIVRGMWTAETIHGIEGAEKAQEIQI
jgi:hypothetical protein